MRVTLDEIVERGRIGSLCAAQRRLLEMCENDKERLKWHTLLASSYQSGMGDGVRARESFIEAYEAFARIPEDELTNESEYYAAMCCGALMTLSLSYEEAIEWGEKSISFKKATKFMRGILHQIQHEQKSGLPWHEVVKAFTVGLYDDEHEETDLGRYGEAASLLHILLANHEEMEIPEDSHREYMLTYCNLIIRLSEANIERMRESDCYHPNECVVPLRTAYLLVAVFCETHQYDEDAGRLCGRLKRWTDDLKREGAVAHEKDMEFFLEFVVPSEMQRKKNKRNEIIQLVVLGILLVGLIVVGLLLWR